MTLVKKILASKEAAAKALGRFQEESGLSDAETAATMLALLYARACYLLKKENDPAMIRELRHASQHTARMIETHYPEGLTDH